MDSGVCQVSTPQFCQVDFTCFFILLVSFSLLHPYDDDDDILNNRGCSSLIVSSKCTQISVRILLAVFSLKLSQVMIHLAGPKAESCPRSCSTNTAHLCQSRWSQQLKWLKGELSSRDGMPVKRWKTSIIHTSTLQIPLEPIESKKNQLPERFWTSCRCLTCNFIYITPLLNQRSG